MAAARHDPRAKKASPLPPIDLNPRTEPVLDFPDRELGTMRPADYAELGFMCGLEIHQQLATAGKLFCRCPSGRRTTAVDAELLRHMRPTLSEMGEYDGCALMEFKTRKEIVYLLERSTVCTYEMDDTPPFEIDIAAVRAALEISASFNLKLVSELHVMRKQYLDGSIPTGFQRTAMVGVDGAIPFRGSELGNDRILRIRQLTLEEDSCREVSDIGHRITFRTDRLGMPLTETVTEPDLLTPLDVAAGGRLIADVTRASLLVLRGAGAARQDVNVSIAGSRRVELKGVPSHRLLPRLVHVEAFRHLELLRIRAELRHRGIDAAVFELDGSGAPWEISDLACELGASAASTGPASLQRALDQGETCAAVKLLGCRGLLAHPTQPGLTFAHELAERVRVIACLEAEPFLMHSDAAPDHPLMREARAALRADRDDALVAVWGPWQDVATAVREIIARTGEACVGIPSETRQAHADGTTGFERILPGPERMYPDTDTPPLPIPDDWIDAAENSRIEPPWTRGDRYVAAGLPEPLARRLAVAVWADLYDALGPLEPALSLRLAWILDQRLRRHIRRGGGVPGVDRLGPVLAAVSDGQIAAQALGFVLEAVWQQPDRRVADIIDQHMAAITDLDDRLARITAEHERVRGRRPGASLRWAMGIAFEGTARGAVAPATIAQRIRAVIRSV